MHALFLPRLRRKPLNYKVETWGYLSLRPVLVAGDLPEGTLRAILKQAGVDVEDFIAR